MSVAGTNSEGVGDLLVPPSNDGFSDAPAELKSPPRRSGRTKVYAFDW